MWYEARLLGRAHRAEHQQAVEEDGDERAEDELVGGVAHEMAQQRSSTPTATRAATTAAAIISAGRNQ